MHYVIHPGLPCHLGYDVERCDTLGDAKRAFAEYREEQDKFGNTWSAAFMGVYAGEPAENEAGRFIGPDESGHTRRYVFGPRGGIAAVDVP